MNELELYISVYINSHKHIGQTEARCRRTYAKIKNMQNNSMLRIYPNVVKMLLKCIAMIQTKCRQRYQERRRRM